MDSFENYLLFAGAVNLGFTLFSQLKDNIIKTIEESAKRKQIYYASLLDICKTSVCEKCNEKCRHRLSGEEDSTSTKSDVFRLLGRKIEESKSLAENFEKWSIRGAILSIFLISIFECFIPQNFNPNIWVKIFSLLFLLPLFTMTVILWIVNKNKWKGKDIETLVIGVYCKKAIKKAKKDYGELEEDLILLVPEDFKKKEK